MTERYKAFLGVQFEADTVKKVRIRGREGEREVFVLPLVEHKTDVDYDVAMQLLRYMAVIWYDCKRQQEGLKEGSSSLKGFYYPPIIPIVYYEGRENEMSLVMMINRIQSPEDFSELLDTSREYVDEIYNGSPADIRAIYQDILWSLLRKMNVPVEESDRKLEEADGRLNTIFRQLISICQSKNLSQDGTLACLQEQYGLNEAEAISAIEQFWQRKQHK